MVSGFNILTRTMVDGNEQVDVSATYMADIFTESGGLPDVFVGRLSLPGTAQFTYLGRDPSVNPLGTFVTELTDFVFEGMLNGNTFEVKQNPEKTSKGLTTIVQSPDPPIRYSVSGSLEIFALFSFNGSPFMQAPPRMAGLDQAPEPVPEPASSFLAGSILVALVVLSSRSRRLQ
jgi:hypothetical protein